MRRHHHEPGDGDKGVNQNCKLQRQLKFQGTLSNLPAKETMIERPLFYFEQQYRWTMQIDRLKTNKIKKDHTRLFVMKISLRFLPKLSHDELMHMWSEQG